MRVKNRRLGRDCSIETPTFFTAYQYTQITNFHFTSLSRLAGSSIYPASYYNSMNRIAGFTDILSNMKNRDNHDNITANAVSCQTYGTIDSFYERVRRYRHGKLMG